MRDEKNCQADSAEPDIHYVHGCVSIDLQVSQTNLFWLFGFCQAGLGPCIAGFFSQFWFQFCGAANNTAGSVGMEE